MFVLVFLFNYLVCSKTNHKAFIIRALLNQVRAVKLKQTSLTLANHSRANIPGNQSTLVANCMQQAPPKRGKARREVTVGFNYTSNRGEKCDVMLPWWHYFWMTTKPTTTATARRTAKNNMSILTNNNFGRASRYFVHFLLPSLQHYDMKLANFTSPLYGVDEHNTKIVAFFF